MASFPFHSGPSHHSARRVPPRGASWATPRRVGRGCWPCVIRRFHQVHPHPPPRPLSANALVSSQRPTCRQLSKSSWRSSSIV